MSAGHTNPVPCLTCGVPHAWTHELGWKARDANGKIHPYDKRQGELLTIGRPRNDGNESALFGALEKCGRCKALLEPGDADPHDQFHQLVDEVAAIAWRLARQHDTGGEAA